MMLGFLRKKKPPRPFVSAIIAAAGSSARMSGDNKLLLELGGIPVLARAMLAFEACEAIDEIILVAREDLVVEYANLARDAGVSKLTQAVSGGNSRLMSVYRGMAAVNADARFVAVHDGARPCIRPEEIERVCTAAFEASAAVAVAPVTDTVKRAKGASILSTEDRESLVCAQTPQVADRALLYAALERAVASHAPVTDESMALEQMGVRPRAVMLGRDNVKITTREDWLLAGLILDEREGF